MRTSRYMIAFAALVFVAFHPAFAAGEGSAEKAEGSAEKKSVSLEVLREGYAATMKALVEVEVLSSKEYLRLPWIPPVVKMRPGYIPQDSGPYYYRFVRSGERFAASFYDRDAARKKAIDWTVTDGKVSLHVVDESGKPDARELGRGIRTPRNVGIDVSFGTSLLFTGWYNGPTPPAAFAAEGVELFPEPIVIDGVETYGVAADLLRQGTFKCWLAPSRSYLPVKVELWTKEGLSNRREFKDFKELSDGTWFPRTIVETHYKVTQGKVAFEVEWKAEEVTVNPKVDDALFDTSDAGVPDGFTIQDDAAKTVYIKAGPVPDGIIVPPDEGGTEKETKAEDPS